MAALSLPPVEPSPDDASPAGVTRGRRLLRRLMWVLLAAILLLVVGMGVAKRIHEERRPAPQVLSYLPGFLLTNRDGREVRLDELEGAPWVADFIFTHCPGPCPLMTQKLAELGPRLPAGVRRVSFTVDPENDTPPVLAAYAERFHAPADWLFLTGDREAIWELSVTGFKLGLAKAEAGGPPAEGPIIHALRFVLIDSDAGIRGYYDPFDPKETERLLAELSALRREEREEAKKRPKDP